MEVSLVIDALGMKCPLPILKMKKGLAQIKVGEILLLKTDDPHAFEDIQSFCSQTKHILIRQELNKHNISSHYIQRM